MHVHALGDTDVAVAHHFGEDGDGDAAMRSNRRERVPQIMERDRIGNFSIPDGLVVSSDNEALGKPISLARQLPQPVTRSRLPPETTRFEL